ncbi:hypothetical protein PCASD_15855 [Puccinia coronata f. sp. avenae]|uniref:DUF6589 domain-containing protein n=1 Tax=Puccinia coronata f. sp. avenae TaxID=200324 RepID=A0A2N5SSE1_9BASI|nr:hypothetical protein PCASD_15855 [Puccinia coronata f. sp. avenae]
MVPGAVCLLMARAARILMPGAACLRRKREGGAGGSAGLPMAIICLKHDQLSTQERRQLYCNSKKPFLYKLISSKLQANLPQSGDLDSDDDSNSENEGSNDSDSTSGDVDLLNKDASSGILHSEGPEDSDIQINKDVIRKQKYTKRAHAVASAACSMIHYASNRRINGFQLKNSLVFFACGMTERLNNYLHYIGLACSQGVAHSAINSLGLHAEKALQDKFKAPSVFAPLICIDNVDFEEKVHMKSISKKNRAFHGTWGYLHTINPMLLSQVPHEHLSLKCYKDAMREYSKRTIKPAIFFPSVEETIHFKLVMKSQIAHVATKYVTTCTSRIRPVNLDVPPIDPITPSIPDITMLKLMMASDNSSSGIADVLEGITQQANIPPSIFFSELRVLEGDLATCSLIESLRALRRPNNYPHESLENNFTLLGASHVLWNFAQALNLLHHGNNTKSSNTGVWRLLAALGIPSDQPTSKKDFNLMIANMRRVHYATILSMIMATKETSNRILTEEKEEMTPGDIDDLVDKVYEKFMSVNALEKAKEDKDHRLMNLMLQVRDFATVVECDNAMRTGDIGRVLSMWRLWSVMAHSIKGLNKYGIQLPRMLLLLTKALPEGLQKVLRHSLLISPTGRPGHFVAKDFYLELQNYWLKYFFNRTGTGTKILRLVDKISINVPTLQKILRDAQGESGKKQIYQSHKCKMSLVDLNSFLRMAEQYNLCCVKEGRKMKNLKEATTNVLSKGFSSLQEDYARGGIKIQKFNPSTVLDHPDENAGDKGQL